MDALVTKECFKCGEGLNLSDYYKHPKMGDGHLNKCKICTKRDVISNRDNNLAYYRACDVKRGSRHTADSTRDYRKRNPKKYTAHSLISNLVRDGKLEKLPCEVCGAVDNVHGHHDDYDKPAEVRWLCAEHHSAWHRANGEALNGK